MQQFWNRYIELNIADIVITNDDLDIEFNEKNSTGDEAGSANIRVYNLADTTRQKLQRGAIVIIKAGYQEDFGTIFSGTIKEVEDVPDGADIATDIFCNDETTNALSTKPKTRYPKGATYESIVQSLFINANIPVGRIEDTNLTIDAEWTTGPDMTVFMALERIKADVKEKAGITYNSYIKKGAGYFVREESRYEEIYILTPETGLIDVQKVDNEDDDVDYNIKTLMIWKITQDSLLDIDSIKVKGEFRVVDYEKIAGDEDYFVQMEVKAS